MNVYSHSSLSSYENCPLAFKFRYIDRINRENRESIEAFMGSRVHEVLEKLYIYLKYTKLTSLDELLALYYSSWDRHWYSGIFILRNGLTPEHYRELGARCISDYYKRFSPFDKGRALGIEKSIILPLDEAEKYKIRGVIDRIYYLGGGTYEVHDYKTSGNLITQEYADNDRQLALYQMAVERMYADVKDVRLIWHYLTFDKDICSRRTPEKLQELKIATIDLIEEIETKKKSGVFQAREGLCDWCDYAAICPRHKHQHGVMALSAREIKIDEGVSLVDKYAFFKEQVEVLEVMVERARQNLLTFSAAKDMDVIWGSGKKAIISRYSVATFPGKNDETQKELVEILKASGRWDEISTLDGTALKHAVKNAGWPTLLKNQVNEFERKSAREVVRINEIKDAA